ncbi:hypothetical protein [Aureimonas pseudogalii]|uniref:Uncharacterized protein n=1 Tax=Aureimonas pseudogalii TaxID=1744844 RepID=A0A7W6EC24_9HYPH|nr:hypothetical protein [Aureimonas pseudogalii]MBB3997271.1 hypothetical protein [Aureimonas pseudogalii]
MAALLFPAIGAVHGTLAGMTWISTTLSLSNRSAASAEAFQTVGF